MEATEAFDNQLLGSGVRLIGQRMEGVESAAVGVLIGAGARDEDESVYGISHFVDQMLFRGTETLDSRDISDRFDALGVSYNSSAGLEMTLLSAVMVNNRLPPALDLLTDVVRNPSFPVDAVDMVRTLILQERRQREDQPGQMVMEEARQKFFAGSPLSHDVLGSEKTLQAITRQNIADYWSSYYTANNIVISIAGNFDWPSVVDQFERLTSGWVEGRGREVVREPQPKPGISVIEREMAQENIGFAFPGVSVNDPHYYAAALLAQALGGGTTSRLFQEVREKRGLAYAVQA
ncbi:MAG: M16 family metallopeptidase, partial [Chloroflexota bacterium]